MFFYIETVSHGCVKKPHMNWTENKSEREESFNIEF